MKLSKSEILEQIEIFENVKIKTGLTDTGLSALKELLLARECIEEMELMKPWLLKWLGNDSTLDGYIATLDEYNKIE